MANDNEIQCNILINILILIQYNTIKYNIQ